MYRGVRIVGRIHVRLRVRVKSHECAIRHVGSFECREHTVYTVGVRTEGRIHVRLRVMVKSHKCAIGHAGSLECGLLLGQIAQRCDHRHGLFGVLCARVL